uniref:CS domain-containing protein n=1 Tax=Monopterus albus TaxID=43700 RepID=A0A3Q3IMZ2_MONAL
MLPEVQFTCLIYLYRHTKDEGEEVHNGEAWKQLFFQEHVGVVMVAILHGKEIIKGKLFDTTVSDEATWTLEDKCLIRIILMKTNREAGNCWSSLLEGDYCANAWVQDQMQRKLTLERFQRENPGFDFSGAEISGNFAGGGPDFSSLQK